MRKPRLVVSKCLDSQKCRYDGQGYNDKIITSLKNHIDIKTVCPEIEIGLSIPRKPIRIEKHGEDLKLMQYKSDIDYTNTMSEFACEFTQNLNEEDIDGFILKSKSPSCGIKDVKVYPKGSKMSLGSKESGIFSKEIINKYNKVPIEDEGRLKNFSIRDDFFTKIFTINKFKDCKNIIDFHKYNNILLKSYDDEKILNLDSIIKKEKLQDEDIYNYENLFYEIILSKRNKKSKMNIINNIFNRYEDMLQKEEKEVFMNLLISYEEEKIPFSVLVVAIKIYATRFKDSEILKQTFLDPYPKELIEISDSGKGRDF